MPQLVFMKFGMYIMEPEPILTACLIYPSCLSVCLYVYIARQRFGNRYVRNNTRIVGLHFFAVRVVSK
jgi:hypothetical protein